MSTRERWVDEHALQRQLRDLICLAVVGDHVRWTVTDDDELADWLAEAAEQWRSWAEQTAARLIASDLAPDGRVRSIAKDIRVNWVPSGWLSSEAARALTTRRLTLVAEWARYRESQTEGADAELLGTVADGLEAQLRARVLRAAASATTPLHASAAALRALDDARPSAGGGPVWGTGSEDLNATVLEWRAGEGPAEHVNEERDVLVVVLAGSAIVRIGDDESELFAGETTIIAKGWRRKISAGRRGVRYVSVHRRRPPLQIAPASGRDT